MRLKDKVAIVTGSSRGIGNGIAEGFIKEGAKVVICGTKEENAKRAVKSLKEKYPSADLLAVELNVSNSDSIINAFNKVIDAYGKLDILVNNAGITFTKAIKEMTEDEWLNVMNVNSNGVFRCCKQAVKYMSKGSSIINITSMVGLNGSNKQSAYAASKASIIGLTKSLAKELGPEGIRVNAVAPGMIGTDMVAGFVTEELKQYIINMTPLRRMGEVEDLQGITILLASDESSFITNTVINVDGGILM